MARGKIEKVVKDQIRQSLEVRPKEAEFYSKYDRNPLKHLEKAGRHSPLPPLPSQPLIHLWFQLQLVGLPLMGPPADRASLKRTWVTLPHSIPGFPLYPHES